MCLWQQRRRRPLHSVGTAVLSLDGFLQWLSLTFPFGRSFTRVLQATELAYTSTCGGSRPAKLASGPRRGEALSPFGVFVKNSGLLAWGGFGKRGRKARQKREYRQETEEEHREIAGNVWGTGSWIRRVGWSRQGANSVRTIYSLLLSTPWAEWAGLFRIWVWLLCSRSTFQLSWLRQSGEDVVEPVMWTK